MFGHTLITLSKDEEKPSLESLSISYMAQPAEGDFAPVYFMKGLTGGYQGNIRLFVFMMY